MHTSRGSLTTAALASAVLLAPTVGFSIDFNECASFECDGSGCLIFRTDQGMAYELIVPGDPYEPNYTPDRCACITGTLKSGCTPTCNGVIAGCVTEISRSPWYATSGMYSTTDEFKQGQFLNLNTANDEIRINDWPQTKMSDPPVSPYIWVACSQRGTVVRIATEDHYSPVDQRCVAAGEILGEYFTTLTSTVPYPGTEVIKPVCGTINSSELDRQGGDPSRTTVDYDGNVCVANRSDGPHDDHGVGTPRNRTKACVELPCGCLDRGTVFC